MGRFPVAITRIFHLFTLGYNLSILSYWMGMDVQRKTKADMPDLQSDWWQYLTVWNMVIQGSYFMIVAVDDFLQISTSRKTLSGAKELLGSVRDVLFQSMALPLCMCVVVVFWSLYAYDREVIYPAEMDDIIPYWLNHLLHTATAFFPWLDLVICQRPFDHCKLRYAVGMGSMAIYNAVLIAAAHWQGYWTYPFLGLMTTMQRGLFYAVLYCIYTTMYILGYKVNVKICEFTSSVSKVHLHGSTDKKLL